MVWRVYYSASKIDIISLLLVFSECCVCLCDDKSEGTRK
jgi:hypothetical protein